MFLLLVVARSLTCCVDGVIVGELAHQQAQQPHNNGCSWHPATIKRGFYGFFLKRKPEGMLNAGSYFLAAFFAGAFLAAGAASGAGVAAGFGVAPVMSTSSTVKIRAE